MKISDSISIQEDSPCGKIYVTVDRNEQGEIARIGVTTKGKSGTCVKIIASMLDKLFHRKIELYNLMLETGKHPRGKLVNQCIEILNNEACHKLQGHSKKDGVMTYSCLDAVAHALKSWKDTVKSNS